MLKMRMKLNGALVAALMMLCGGVEANAATLTVSSLANSGTGTLRAQVAAAAPGDTIDFSVTGTITLTTFMDIGKDLTITGPGAGNLSLNGNAQTRMFRINSGVVRISGLTLTNGSANSQSVGGVNVIRGGTINLVGGALTLTSCILSDSSARHGGGIYVGGGSLTISSSTLSGSSDGSGIYMDGGSLLMTDSTVSGNLAGESGGGVFLNTNATATVKNSTVSGNSARGQFGGGGGFFNHGNLTITQSTISGNSTTAFRPDAGVDGGGGIYNFGVLTVTASTISANTAYHGGGIHTGSNPLTMSNSIVAGNTVYNPGFAPDLLGNATGDYNLLQNLQNTPGRGLSGTNNITGQPALLGPLANNGGPTQTHALLAGSPAIDKGSATGTDQRGLTRPSDDPSIPNAAGGNGADIGAFEVQIAPPPAPADLTIVKSHIGNFTQGDTGKTYSITVTNSGGAATSGTVSVVDTLPSGLTATAISGIGWTCNFSNLTCTRTDALAANSSYPAITLTVNVAANAPGSVTNQATVSGGGETNTANNTANDPTTIGAAAPRYSIAGTVSYGISDAGQMPAAVSGVSLNMTGSASGSALSDGSGNYLLSNLLGGSYTVTPSKSGDVRGINSTDATRIQQHMVGMTTLSANQLIAADTDGSGAVNSTDATRIQQRQVGMQTQNIIGQWKFVPASRQYIALGGNATAQDYQAVLVGEVSGNWATAASLANNFQTEGNEILPETDDQNQTAERFSNDLSGQISKDTKQSIDSSANESPTESLSPAADIQVSLPTNAMASNGATVTVPITVSQIPAGSSIESFDFSVFYNPAVLQPAATPGSNTGTLSANCSVLPFSPVAGRVIVSGACVQAITSGSGVLYNLTFNVIGASGQTSGLPFVNPANNANTFQFNNGAPTVATTNGQLTVLAPTAASVTVSGRVAAGLTGRGVARATVSMTGADGIVRRATTNPFGYYRFADVPAGETYVFIVKAKSRNVEFAPQVVTVNEDVADLNFTGW